MDSFKSITKLSEYVAHPVFKLWKEYIESRISELQVSLETAEDKEIYKLQGGIRELRGLVQAFEKKEIKGEYTGGYY